MKPVRPERSNSVQVHSGHGSSTATGWLIEHPLRASWLDYDDDADAWAWTDDSAQAVRFQRKQDALKTLRALKDVGLRGLVSGAWASEHIWSD